MAMPCYKSLNGKNYKRIHANEWGKQKYYMIQNDNFYFVYLLQI